MSGRESDAIHIESQQFIPQLALKLEVARLCNEECLFSLLNLNQIRKLFQSYQAEVCVHSQQQMI